MDFSTTVGPVRKIAFVGNYLPRACGIATFTFDLSEAVTQRLRADTGTLVVAMNDTPKGYDYPERVEFQIREHHRLDYTLAADYLNSQGVDVVSVQHEFGIFGGLFGEYVLPLLRRLKVPVAVTCHSVPQHPDPAQREVLREIAGLAARLVVMSSHAKELITSLYRAEAEKVTLIPHGIHPYPFVDAASYKCRLGLRGRDVLLTFGLLGRNKGIEYMLDAMPTVLAHHPAATYVVLGATHPAIARSEGEAYRESLLGKLADAGLTEHVRFVDEFVDLPRLLEFIGAADACVMPYLDMDQATSGVLAYAMAMGKAVVSTPYRYAREMLAEGRGRLVPPADAAALACETLALLGDERATMSMRKKAYAFSRCMSWPVVARSYLALFEEMRRPSPRPVVMPAVPVREGTDATRPLGVPS